MRLELTTVLYVAWALYVCSIIKCESAFTFAMYRGTVESGEGGVANFVPATEELPAISVLFIDQTRTATKTLYKIWHDWPFAWCRNEKLMVEYPFLDDIKIRWANLYDDKGYVSEPGWVANIRWSNEKGAFMKQPDLLKERPVYESKKGASTHFTLWHADQIVTPTKMEPDDVTELLHTALGNKRATTYIQGILFDPRNSHYIWPAHHKGLFAKYKNPAAAMDALFEWKSPLDVPTLTRIAKAFDDDMKLHTRSASVSLEKGALSTVPSASVLRRSASSPGASSTGKGKEGKAKKTATAPETKAMAEYSNMNEYGYYNDDGEEEEELEEELEAMLEEMYLKGYKKGLSRAKHLKGKRLRSQYGRY